MLDRQTDKLLRLLAHICEDGSHKVIEINDLIKQMQPRYKVNAASIEQMTRYLSNSEMIDIKYKDENVYCVSVLPRGRLNSEARGAKNYSVMLGRRLALLTILGSFAAAFAGALLAGIIMGL